MILDCFTITGIARGHATELLAAKDQKKWNKYEFQHRKFFDNSISWLMVCSLVLEMEPFYT